MNKSTRHHQIGLHCFAGPTRSHIAFVACEPLAWADSDGTAVDRILDLLQEHPAATRPR